MSCQKERIHTGELYLPLDKEILTFQLKCLEKLYDYNATRPSEQDKRQQLLKEMFAEIGEGCYIEPPLHSNFGCKNVHFGKNVYANFNLTLVDDTFIYVGDYVMFAPNVTVATAAHPIDPSLREQGYQYNLPVRIGNNCWIGTGAIILPGITIGDNVVIGAGSIVTKDIPSNVVAVGNPCRILRQIGDRDKAKKSDAEGEEKNAATDEAKPEKPKVFLTEAEFATTLERIEENLRTDAKTMRSGRFRASPGSDLCKFCKMAAICRKYEGREADEGGGD